MMGVWIVMILLCVAFITFVLSLLVVWKLMHPKRRPVLDSPASLNLYYEDITFRSRDQKVELKGWFIPAVQTPKMTIIFAHGYRANRLQESVSFLEIAKQFVHRGYNVLLFDFRNCGQSGGHLTTVGYDEKQDVLGAIDWCKSRHPVPIGLVGYSMGAASSLLAAAECKDVAGIIADSSFSNLNSYLFNHFSVWSKLPKYPFSPMMLLIIKYVMRVNPKHVKPIHSLKHIYPRPVLFIHGEEDMVIPCSNSEKMFKCYTDVFSYWKVPKANHIRACSLYPDIYVKKLIQFFDSLGDSKSVQPAYEHTMSVHTSCISRSSSNVLSQLTPSYIKTSET